MILNNKSILHVIASIKFSHDDIDNIISCNNMNYDCEVIIYKGNIIFDSNIQLGSSDKSCMLIVKVFGNLTINEGVLVTPINKRKGFVLYTTGTLINNGTISMTSRGIQATGENVYLYQNRDKSYEYVPAQGAAGGAGFGISRGGTMLNGNNGINGINRQTGGGGSGSGRNWAKAASVGRGGNGTSYSGGAGSGAANTDGTNGGNAYSAQGSDIGGAGSNGVVVSRNSSGFSQISTGGQGNPNGGAASYRSGITGYHCDVYGTGGLLIVYGFNLINNNIIESNGGDCIFGLTNHTNGVTSSGGASGGGSVNIFYDNKISNNGSIVANGGRNNANLSKYGLRVMVQLGGAGGNGSVTLTKVNLRKYHSVYETNLNFYNYFKKEIEE